MAGELLDANNTDEVAIGIRPQSPEQPVATFIEATVNGSNDAERLFIFTGIALLRKDARDEDGVLKPGLELDNPDKLESVLFTIILGKNLDLAHKEEFRGSSTFVSLADISNEDTEDFEHAVLGTSTLVKDDGSLRLEVLAGVKGESTIVRLSYQAIVLVGIARGR